MDDTALKDSTVMLNEKSEIERYDKSDFKCVFEHFAGFIAIRSVQRAVGAVRFAGDCLIRVRFSVRGGGRVGKSWINRL